MATKASESPVREEEVDAGKEAVLAAYNNLLEASEHFKFAARAAGLDLKEEASDKLQQGRDKAITLGQQVNDYAHERPLTALSVAFAAGFILAQVFGRRE